MEDVIELLREQSEDVPVPLELPDEEDLVVIEEELFLPLPFEFREFLLKVSDVVFGSIEPVTVTDPQSHTYLPEVAAMAWSLGISRELIPLCEVSTGYYCVTPEGEVSLINPDTGEVGEDEWPSIWHWVKEVWLES